MSTQTSLPEQIPPPSASIGSTEKGDHVTFNFDWYLFFYNLSQQILTQGSSLPVSQSDLIDMVDLDASTSDIPALVRNFANAFTMLADALQYPVNLASSETYGVLPVVKGGTGLSNLTAGYIPYGNGTSAFSSNSNLTFDGNTLLAGGAISLTHNSSVIPNYGLLLQSGLGTLLTSAYQLGVYVNGAQRMWFSNTGGVSIGNTTDPGAGNLSVTGTGTFATLESTGLTILPSLSGYGVKVDNSTPTYPWRDITGEIVVKGTGSHNPNWATFVTNIEAYQFGVGNEVWINFHMPHDYVPGSDVFLHVHWSTTSATIASVTWSFDVTYAKGFGQQAYNATSNYTVTQASAGAYFANVAETQISSGGAVAGNALETDGLILAHIVLSADATPLSPFVFSVDVHYQSTNIGTKNKAPTFYN